MVLLPPGTGYGAADVVHVEAAGEELHVDAAEAVVLHADVSEVTQVPAGGPPAAER